jgi:hypothetical protein
MSESKNQGKAMALDPGTMFFQTATIGEDDKTGIKTIRNAFVEMMETDDIEDILKQNNWQYVKDGSKYYVIGEDSLRVAKMFPGKVELRRPMKDGVLNKDEDKKMLILAKLIESTIGKAPNKSSVVCACISSPSVDGSHDNTFHRSRLEGMLKNLGWNVKIIEEGLAIILSERPVVKEPDGTESPYSGIAISFGSGRVNCVLAYKGIQIVGLSVVRAGDWLDEKVSEQTGVPIAQVISKKEKLLDFTKLDYNDDVLFALDAYYSAMIEHVFHQFARKFNEVKSQFEAPLDIVVAGGTAMPKGFIIKLEEVVRQMDLPFKIKDIKISQDPRNSVVKGCLTQAILYRNKISKAESVDDLLGTGEK